MERTNFLCEIGTEEIPAGYIPGAIEYLKKIFTEKLTAERIDFAGITVYATPRRLIICGENVASTQRAEMLEMKGPAADRAFDADGKPSKALQGFLTGNGLTEKDLEKRDTPKGAYMFAKKQATTHPSEDILPELISGTILSIPFPKTMHWSDKTVVFARPIRYLCILFNDKVLPVEIDGIVSSNKTRGHYIRSTGMFEVKKISDYAGLLRTNNVIYDQNERKNMIREALSKAVASINCVLVEDEDLLDLVTFIVESPHVVNCTFKESFLEIPDVVLITEMKEHQKYFAVRDKSGKLSNNFLVISNNPPSDHIRKGNERVITARFNDAGFFFREDRKNKLEDKIDSLKTVLFHKELGSIYDKVERVRLIASVLAETLGISGDDAKKIDRAAMLCKADLNTAMVFEFTSLQGQIGRIYARLDGEDEAVCNAIDDHYKPRFNGDPLPDNIVSIVLSIAEKLDNLYGSFSVGNIPKGSADPYALRRQSAAIVDLLITKKLHVPLDAVAAKIAGKYKDGAKHTAAILEFIQVRAKTFFAESGFKYDEIDAVLSTGMYDFYELFVRASSLHEFRADEKFGSMLLSFKRMNNILSAFFQKNKGYALKFDASLLSQDEEKKLAAFFEGKCAAITEHVKANKYKELFAILIDAKPSIDLFFDKIMVMADDVKVRDNRLALLDSIISPFAKILDFSKIAD